ncbi:DUF6884 domain-containing protein [Haloarcula salinisoli]|uniref:DUF6884 domain-containing protein n=1 Tax=Haloarcula salinisoli TaxID=2487746 RepID=A0A8J8CAZ7_9EURY|nr:DUF6884 domain-containing protein [Halomicroarcula salinisoli]MBX0305699.1 hypothetical protein [Halomicroarcula salinisoli]
MSQEIGLVSCVKTKQDQPAPPKALYTSSYFRKMRAYAEQYHDDWWILSAKHGLLAPDGPSIEPYDETLSGAPVARKREWADQVAAQLAEHGLLSEDVTLVLHAGKDYYEELLPRIEDSGVTVEIPTEGLAIGETQAWYNEQL